MAAMTLVALLAAPFAKATGVALAAQVLVSAFLSLVVLAESLLRLTPHAQDRERAAENSP
jgi:hypothetical protein